jgi:hypothetical protein
MEFQKKHQSDKIKNVVGSVLLNLFMDVNGKCKLSSISPSTGLNRFQHLNMKIAAVWILYNKFISWTVTLLIPLQYRREVYILRAINVLTEPLVVLSYPLLMEAKHVEVDIYIVHQQNYDFNSANVNIYAI